MMNWLLSDANLDKLAKAEVDVIAQHYGLTASTPTFKCTAIMGAAIATVEKMAAYLIGKNPASQTFALDYAKHFIAESINESARSDVAFAQSCLETGNFKFGGDVKPEQNNFAGIWCNGQWCPVKA